MKRSSKPSSKKWVTTCRCKSAAASEISTPSNAIWTLASATSSSVPLRACTAFFGHIIVGLDARDGKVATDGWSKLTRHDVLDLAHKFEDDGVDAIIYTDIGRDGMLSGVNVEATVRLAQHVNIPVFASGGVADIRDVEALCAVEDEGVAGAILGRSLYEGTLDLSAALARADELSGNTS